MRNLGPVLGLAVFMDYTMCRYPLFVKTVEAWYPSERNTG